MRVKREWQEKCVFCGEMITLREYEGLEGGKYTEHHCPEQAVPPTDIMLTMYGIA